MRRRDKNLQTQNPNELYNEPNMCENSLKRVIRGRPTSHLNYGRTCELITF